MANPETSRRLQDTQLAVSVALPNAANTVATNIIDLGSVTPYPATEHVVVQITTSLATGANNKNINVALQHSDDTNVSNFANIPELAPKVIAGNTANFPATTVNVALPPGAKRYIRATALGEANGGNSADGTLTVKLLF
jgi:hypothetical protein